MVFSCLNLQTIKNGSEQGFPPRIRRTFVFCFPRVLESYEHIFQIVSGWNWSIDCSNAVGPDLRTAVWGHASDLHVYQCSNRLLFDRKFCLVLLYETN